MIAAILLVILGAALDLALGAALALALVWLVSRVKRGGDRE